MTALGEDNLTIYGVTSVTDCSHDNFGHNVGVIISSGLNTYTVRLLKLLRLLHLFVSSSKASRSFTFEAVAAHHWQHVPPLALKHRLPHGL
jgi:hypothetical protein